MRKHAAAVHGQLRSNGWFDGRGRALDAAVVTTVSVALPVIWLEVKVIVFGAVKFKSGGPKLQLGKSTAFVSTVVTVQPRVTPPVNPSTTFKVTS